MRVAVVSDIHANYHAFAAVLERIDAAAPDQVWCLGDLVGYGPRPNRCSREAAMHTSFSLSGNHDLAASGQLDIATFALDAGAAIRWTAEVLDEDIRDYLAGLPTHASRDQAELFHGSPRDPVWDYVLTEEAVAESFALTTTPLVLVGHSHIPLAFSEGGGRISGGLAPHGTIVELDGRCLLNPGSVGQPRDGDSRAAWMLLDLDEGTAAFERVEYPIEKTQAEIVERGLPDTLAARLQAGL